MSAHEQQAIKNELKKNVKNMSFEKVEEGVKLIEKLIHKPKTQNFGAFTRVPSDEASTYCLYARD